MGSARATCCTTPCTRQTIAPRLHARFFSAPLNWTSVLGQLEAREAGEAHIALAHTGDITASIVKLHMSSGLAILNRHTRQATVRRPAVVQLIRMFRDKGHPDYQRLSDDEVQRRASQLADTDEPTAPPDVLELFDEEMDNERSGQEPTGVDKAATPAERTWGAVSLARDMERARPNTLLLQRDSGVKKDRGQPVICSR